VPMMAAGKFYTCSYTIGQANFPTNDIMNISFVSSTSNGFAVNYIKNATPQSADLASWRAPGAVTPLTAAALLPVVSAAIKDWVAVKHDATVAGRLAAVPVQIVHLGNGGYLGLT